MPRVFDKLLALFAVALIAAFGFIAKAAHAQTPGFDGKSITLIVPYDPGGSTDIVARIFAKYLPELLPGNPSVIVRNMPGGGGLAGVNYAGEVSKADGLTLLMWTWNPIAHILKDPGLRVPMDKFRSVGGLQFGEVSFIRTDVPPGMKVPTDIVKAQKFFFGGLAVSTTKDLIGRLQLDLIGANYGYVTGYKGSQDLVLGVQRNELQFTSISESSWTSQVKPSMVDTGQVIAVFQAGRPGPNGATRHPGLLDVPTFDEVYKTIHGREPTGDKWELYRFVAPLRSAMADVVWLPPNTPDAITQQFRTAFERLVSDKQFIADYEKAVKSKPVWISGADSQKYLEQLGLADEKIRKGFEAYVEMARKK